jgi:glycosyltransferase
MSDLKISIITTTFNSSASIVVCLASVAYQTCPVEHIIIDGVSTDNTIKIVREFSPNARVVSERDNGIYDAMNKGIRLATGDIIGILNSEDFLADENAVDRVVSAIVDQNVDSCYADIVFGYRADMSRVARKWLSGPLEKKRFRTGWMLPHPTFL